MPFAQFGVDPDTVFTVCDELTVPPDQLKAFQENKDGCVIGRKLAEDREAQGRRPACRSKGDVYPVRPEPDDPRHLRRPAQPRPADVPASTGTTSTRR